MNFLIYRVQEFDTSTERFIYVTSSQSSRLCRRGKFYKKIGRQKKRVTLVNAEYVLQPPCDEIVRKYDGIRHYRMTEHELVQSLFTSEESPLYGMERYDCYQVTLTYTRYTLRSDRNFAVQQILMRAYEKDAVYQEIFYERLEDGSCVHCSPMAIDVLRDRLRIDLESFGTGSIDYLTISTSSIQLEVTDSESEESSPEVKTKMYGHRSKRRKKLSNR